MSANATDYILGCNDGSDWYVGATFENNNDGTFSTIIELPAKNTNFLFTVFEGSSIDWAKAYRPNSNDDFNTYENESLTFTGMSSTGKVLLFPRNSSKARALKLVFNPTTKAFSITRLIVVASGYNGWSTTTDYLSASVSKSEVYTGEVVLEKESTNYSNGFKFVILNNGNVYWATNKGDGYIGDGYEDNGWHEYPNATVNVDGVYSLTASFSDWKWNDPTLVTASVTMTYPYATFSSKYALDFTNVTYVRAYQASMSGTKVLMTRVSGKVPANTGLFLARQEGETSEEIPTTICTTELTGNLMKASTGKPVVSDNLYSLVKRGDDYGFAKVASGYTWAEGKAYLETSATVNAPSLGFSMDDDETTTIHSINIANNPAEEGVMYNLEGKRIDQPSKGVYIVNGKKVIIK